MAVGECKLPWNTASLCEPASSTVLSCSANASCYLLNSDSKVPTLPQYRCLSRYHSLETGYSFGADKLLKANIWDKIHPWCNSTEVTFFFFFFPQGFYTWERCEAYCIKAVFSRLPFIYLSVHSKWAPLLMTYLWWAIHLNSGVSFFF